MIKWFNLYQDSLTGNPKTYYFYASKAEALDAAEDDEEYLGTFYIDIKQKVTKYMVLYKKTLSLFDGPFDTQEAAQEIAIKWNGQGRSGLIVAKIEYEE